MLQERVQRERGDGDERRDDVESAGEQHGDHDDRAEVVDHGKGEQEDPGARRQVGRGQGEHAECERDVGRDRDRPRAVDTRRSPADGERDQRRNDHAADRRDHRQHRLLEPRKLADDQFALQLQPGHEEEQREQAVLGPVADGQVQVQQFRADPEFAECVVTAAQRGIRPDERDRGGDEQDDPAGRLGTQVAGELGDAARF